MVEDDDTLRADGVREPKWEDVGKGRPALKGIKRMEINDFK